MTHVQIRRIAGKLAGTYLAESHTRTMVRVDVGRNLEHETRELGLFRHHDTFLCLHRTRTRRNLHKAVEQFLHTEVVQGRTEEHWSQFPFQVIVHIEFRINPLNQFQFAAQLVRQRRTDMIVQVFRMDIHFHLLRHHLLGRLEKIQLLFAGAR